STSPNFPKLAGQQSEYFIKQMKEFRSHNRSDPAGFEYMWGITRNLNDKQIDGLAAYYEKQATTVSATNTTGPGKTIFENGVPDKGIPACATCHGPEGHGNGQFPRLAGQHADYLVKQLNVFQRTDQRPDGAIMKTVAHDLTPANIDNVTKYIAALK
ncbi:MAG: c-type cytochrome, partial [Burkholderiaceae bacterium]